MSKIIVQKYGGSSVASTEKLQTVARLVTEKRRLGYQVVVVVSAMGDATDDLLKRAQEISKEPDRRELDMLLTVGERISMSLLAMAIRERGQEAVSLTGSQSGIITTASHTNARVMEVRPFRVQDELEAGRVVIVAGYQGVSYKREITTLGRGGSDTTAVALAAALDAEACEIYSDVAGVFTADPRVVPDAKPLPALSYEEMQELAEAGAKVLNAQAVEFAKRNHIAIYAKKTGSSASGTVVRKDIPAPSSGVRGIAHERRVLSVEAHDIPLKQAQEALLALEQEGIGCKQLHLQNGKFSCVISTEDLSSIPAVHKMLERQLGPGCYRDDLGAISLIGAGITRAVLTGSLAHLQSVQIPVHGLSTSSFRISFLLPSDAVPKAAQGLHQMLGLDHLQAEAVLER